jgi:DNA polymerase I
LWPHKWRPSLLDALQIFGLHGIDAGEKDEMRDLILDNETYDPDQRRRIRHYNRSDVIATSALLLAIADRIDMPRALHRGRYQKAVAVIDTTGIPVDTAAVAELLDNRTALKLDYIERNNMGEFYDGTRFVEDRLTDLILRNGWETHWPLTPTGKFETGDDTLGRMAARHPELAPLARLHSQLGACADPRWRARLLRMAMPAARSDRSIL